MKQNVDPVREVDSALIFHGGRFTCHVLIQREHDGTESTSHGDMRHISYTAIHKKSHSNVTFWTLTIWRGKDIKAESSHHCALGVYVTVER